MKIRNFPVRFQKTIQIYRRNPYTNIFSLVGNMQAIPKVDVTAFTFSDTTGYVSTAIYTILADTNVLPEDKLEWESKKIIVHSSYKITDNLYQIKGESIID